MKKLSIDLETYSKLALRKVGTWRYADDCRIVIFGYAYDDDEVQVVDMLHGQALPPSVFEDLQSAEVLKTAYNANFEKAVLSRQKVLVQTEAGIEAKQVTIHTEQWQDTLILAYQQGLAGSLDDMGGRLGLTDDLKKDRAGKSLISLFAQPQVRSALQIEQRNELQKFRDAALEEIANTKWARYLYYNRQDVIAERAIRQKLEALENPMPAREREVENLDWAINNRGVKVDATLVKFALELDKQTTQAAKERGDYLVKGNINSATQLRAWLLAQGLEVGKTLDKGAREEILKQVLVLPDNDSRKANVLEVLRLKSQLAKTSVKKYEAMQNAKDNEDRVHGMLQYYGAQRTGRWAGRLIQLHNLPQNHLDDLAEARELLRRRDFEALKSKYENPSEVLSQLIRTAFVPRDGCRLLCADYSAIEARVLAWLAGESWVLDAFRRGEDIYCAVASQMFGVRVIKNGENGELRQKGKIATLACGYGGGVDALKAFGAHKLGLDDTQLKDIIAQWRKANYNIVHYWSVVESMMLNCIDSFAQQTSRPPLQSIAMQRHADNLYLTLPSGRSLVYPHLSLESMTNKYNNTSPRLCYEGLNMQGKWGKIPTWGGKIVENITQAVARDCLANAMLALDAAGYKIVMHVHDEIICEMKKGQGSVEEMVQIMCKPPAWAQDLPLNAEGFEASFYHK